MNKVVSKLSIKAFKRISPNLPSDMNNGRTIGSEGARISGMFGDALFYYLKGNIVIDLQNEEVEIVRFSTARDEDCIIFNKTANTLSFYGNSTNDWMPYIHLITRLEKEDFALLSKMEVSGDTLSFSDVENSGKFFNYMYNTCKNDYPDSVTYYEASDLDLAPYEDAMKKFKKGDEEEVETAPKENIVEDETIRISSEEELSDVEKMLVPEIDFKKINVPDYVATSAKYIKRRLERKEASNILFFGGAGTGKSFSTKILAALLGLPHYAQSFDLGTDKIEIIAGSELKEGTLLYNDSPLVRAVRDGGVVELQEFYNAKPGVLTSLNKLFEEGNMELANGKVIKRHPNCVIVATSNISYAGGQAIDFSVDSRFRLKFLVDEVSDAELTHRVMLNSGNNDKKIVSKMVKAYKDIKKVLEKEEYDEGFADIRALEAWAELADMGVDPRDAAYATFLPTISKDKAKMDEVMDAYIRQLF